MQLEEAKKWFAWMAGVFPNWTPDKVVLQVWAKEMPEVDADTAIEATKTIMGEEAGKFPPGLFQIINMLREPVKVDSIALEEWMKVKAALSNSQNARFDNPTTAKVVKLLGGAYILGQKNDYELRLDEKRFIEMFKHYHKIEQSESLMIENGKMRRLNA